MNDKNLSLNLYEYLVYSQNKSVRGVSLITDKQYIFYTQLDNSDITHDEIYTKLENEIHPNDKRCGFCQGGTPKAKHHEEEIAIQKHRY